jgi:aspartate racemase
MKHIGIVGCSAEGAALCYRTLCVEGAHALGNYAHPEVSMHTPSLASYVARITRGDWDGVGEIMLDSARRLQAAGAEFLICPDNTIHQAFDYVAARSPLPWLHIADAVADAARERGFQRVGLTGTQWLVDSDVYPRALARHGIACIKPAAAERAECNRFIMDELVHERFTPQCVAWFQGVIERLRLQGCDAVVLGCTEIPLVISDANACLPTLDSTRLLARAALRFSLSGQNAP